ncbi:Sll0314/Alr1548 family TPR repeat-containing protein [Pannus brasiliensis CCIBt3594]|uniref:Sll0314/Alr1548 family TPR repeat-containing protein n=1 Tax=Pannus brasiliensis CCIBt3594 TaxID=1427578 RepID=A0AAW9QDV9_9CHRO
MVVRIRLTKKIALGVSLVTTLLVGGLTNPAFAGDPFRKTNPKPIGDKTEAAFNAIFKDGNYPDAKRLVTEATEKEPNEPLAHAMRASLAYTDKDWETLKTYAEKTTAAARGLQSIDPMRSNLYLAVGSFLEGTYVFQTEGPVSALPRLQQVFQYLDNAEKLGATDPELNLLKGYMDLMLAVNLPFASPDQARERLEKYASPDYLVDRGIALAYRDEKNYDAALRYIDNALKATPENPELLYLKGQILRNQGNKAKNADSLKQALDYYNRAMKKQDQLPEPVKKQLNREQRKVQEEIKAIDTTANR